eukprot:12234_1
MKSTDELSEARELVSSWAREQYEFGALGVRSNIVGSVNDHYVNEESFLDERYSKKVPETEISGRKFEASSRNVKNYNTDDHAACSSLDDHAGNSSLDDHASRSSIDDHAARSMVDDPIKLTALRERIRWRQERILNEHMNSSKTVEQPANSTTDDKSAPKQSTTDDKSAPKQSTTDDKSAPKQSTTDDKSALDFRIKEIKDDIYRRRKTTLPWERIPVTPKKTRQKCSKRTKPKLNDNILRTKRIENAKTERKTEIPRSESIVKTLNNDVRDHKAIKSSPDKSNILRVRVRKKAEEIRKFKAREIAAAREEQRIRKIQTFTDRNLSKRSNLLLRRCFSSLRAEAFRTRVQSDRARAFHKWNAQHAHFRMWRVYVQKERARREAETVVAEMRKESQQNGAATEFHRKYVFRRSMKYLKLFAETSRTEKLLQREEEALKNGVSKFIDAVGKRKELHDSTTNKECTSRKQTPQNSASGLSQSSQTFDSSATDQSHSKCHQHPAHQQASVTLTLPVVRIRKKKQTRKCKPPKDTTTHSEGRVCPQRHARNQEFSNNIRNTQNAGSGSSARPVGRVRNTKSSDSSRHSSAPTYSRDSEMVHAMQRREAEAKERRMRLKKRYEDTDEKRKAELALRREEAAQLAVALRREQIEIRREKTARALKLNEARTHRTRLAEGRARLADMHLARAHLVWRGWRPWRRFVEAVRQRMRSARRFSDFKCLRTALLTWQSSLEYVRMQAALTRTSRLEHALHQGAMFTERFYWRRWTSVCARKREVVRCIDGNHRRRIGRAVFAQWMTFTLDSLEKTRLAAIKRAQQADSLGRSALRRRSFHQWARVTEEGREVRARESERADAGRRVVGWLKEFRESQDVNGDGSEVKYS